MTLLRLGLKGSVPNGQSYLYVLLALVNGAILPIQSNLNAQLARSLNSVPLAADISYLVGSMALISLLHTGWFANPDWSALAKAPRWTLMGGLFGVGYVTATAYFTSILGTTLTQGLIICGQAMTGLVSDHFGWLGVNRRRLTSNRRLVIALLIVAIFLLSLPT